MVSRLQPIRNYAAEASLPVQNGCDRTAHAGLVIAGDAMLPVQGLTEGEVRLRRQRGEGNDAGIRPSRSYWDIARANLFTLFNNLLFAIGAALVALGRYNDALTSVGIGLVNALISTVQEIRAKRQLDQIALVAS